MSGRKLTSNEKTILETVFGDQIDLDIPRIYNNKYNILHPRNAVMAPDGNVYYPKGHWGYSSDISALSTSARGLFVHEFAHVWQAQLHGKNVFSIKDSSPYSKNYRLDYDYRDAISGGFFNLNPEQQAQLLQDHSTGRYWIRR